MFSCRRAHDSKCNLYRQLSILRVCRQLHKEASAEFYNSYTFLAANSKMHLQKYHETQHLCLWAPMMYRGLQLMGSENRLKIRHLWLQYYDDRSSDYPSYVNAITLILDLLSRGHRLRTLGIHYEHSTRCWRESLIYRFNPQQSISLVAGAKNYTKTKDVDEGLLSAQHLATYSTWSIQQVKLEIDATIRSLESKTPDYRRFQTP